MFDKLSILLHEDDTKYTFGEWGEVPNYLEITYSEYEINPVRKYAEKFTLPVFSKRERKGFKHAGDMAFTMMGKVDDNSN